MAELWLQGERGRLQFKLVHFAYTGTWSLNAGRLHARLSAERTTPGPPGVFGMDELDIAVTEYARDGDSVMCDRQFAKQSPGLAKEVTDHADAGRKRMTASGRTGPGAAIDRRAPPGS